MTASHLQLIVSRRREIDEELARLAAQTDELRKELNDLSVAERVMARLSGADVAEASQEAEPQGGPVNVTSRKPEGTPSVPDMIITVLEYARLASPSGGYEPKEITKHIQNEWWPDMPPSVTNSIVWRMWKRGQLEKAGSLYMLPEKNEAADDDPSKEPSAASDQQPQFPDRDPG